tara:strand:+ start:1756 stop:2583 length:828 start_codon:yes stop_codon:yes gene_type:complete
MMSEMQIKRGFVDVPEGQMFYREAGSGPPIVLIHQILRTSLDYKFVMPILAASHRVIAFDSLGCGDSDAPKRPYSIEEHGTAIGQAMEALYLGPVTIAGHHSGADIAMEVALQRPDLIERAVFSGLGYISDTSVLPELQAKASKLGDPETKLDGSHLLEIWEEGVRTNWGKPRFPEDRLDLMSDFFLEQIKTGPRRFEQYVAFFAYDATKKLPNVEVPILFIRSTDDIFMCNAVEDWLHDQPGAKLAEIEVEGGGELPKLYPKPWARAVLEFTSQ